MFLPFVKNKLDLNHWILFFLWIFYCVIHSTLATAKVKSIFEKASGKFFRYYRLAYTIFAAVTLLLILYFQYSFASPALINQSTIKYISFVIFVLPGLIIMMISILKYFKLLSGVRSLFEGNLPTELQKKGIHRYVRHPLYSGTLLFIWGLFFIFPMVNNLIAVGVITGYVLIGIRLEEKKLLIEFGNLYKDYISEVPMLIPDFTDLK
ncbi:MAG: isoprenylcysteine carboxylmethyltransferase family protein [Ginsengibacter sp.]